jgi:hypothetical protein
MSTVPSSDGMPKVTQKQVEELLADIFERLHCKPHSDDELRSAGIDHRWVEQSRRVIQKLSELE